MGDVCYGKCPDGMTYTRGVDDPLPCGEEEEPPPPPPPPAKPLTKQCKNGEVIYAWELCPEEALPQPKPPKQCPDGTIIKEGEDCPPPPAPPPDTSCKAGFKPGPIGSVGANCIPEKMELIDPDENGQCPPNTQAIKNKDGENISCGKMPDMESERDKTQPPPSEGGGGGGASPLPPRDPYGHLKDLIDQFGGGKPTVTVDQETPVEPETPEPDGRATGGVIKDLNRYMKKHKKAKKYQAGGIADLTRDPRKGAAINPVSGYNFGFAKGGLPPMPEYKAGGKLLRGPGDGMSDDIPAVIRGRGEQRAALADGEFVIPADVVSHLGNGSTEAGAKKLYQMMARIRKARTGKSKQAPAVKVDKYLPR
jgi:hypothetical protein